METIIYTSHELEAEQIMSQRVIINEKSLTNYIELIKSRIQENGAKLREYADEMIPPYPFVPVEVTDTHFRISLSRFVLEAALRQLQKYKKRVRADEWLSCANEYMRMPTETKGNRLRDEQVFISLTDEMISAINDLGQFIENLDLNIRNFRSGKSGGVYSYKIIANLAIIWLGRYLAREAQEAYPELIV